MTAPYCGEIMIGSAAVRGWVGVHKRFDNADQIYLSILEPETGAQHRCYFRPQSLYSACDGIVTSILEISDVDCLTGLHKFLTQHCQTVTAMDVLDFYQKHAGPVDDIDVLLFLSQSSLPTQQEDS